MHDVAPATWCACAAMLRDIVPPDVPATLLVVPRWHGANPIGEDIEFIEGVRGRIARGDEVALHGYLHRDDARPPRGPRGWVRRRLLTAGEGEFDALAESTALERIAAGRAELAILGAGIRAFVAPAWLLGSGAATALRATDLEFTCTRDSILRISDGASLHAPSLVWSSRSALRRAASVVWNRRRLRILGTYPLVRIALHPADLCDPRAAAFWRRTIDVLLASREPALEFDVAAETLGARR